MLSQGEEGVFTYTGTDGVKRLNAYKRFQLSSKESPYLYMRIGIPEGKALMPARSALLTNLMLLLSCRYRYYVCRLVFGKRDDRQETWCTR